MPEYKTFKDLVFEKHRAAIEAEQSQDVLHPLKGLHAIMDFDNGYGISVIRYEMPQFKEGTDMYELLQQLDDVLGIPHNNIKYGSRTNNENEWEVGIRYMADFDLDEKNPFNKSIFNNCTEDIVTEIMIKLQDLPCIDSIQNAVDNLLKEKS